MPPVIELTAIRKDYHGLRPLRVRGLTVPDGEIVALDGLDATVAEVLTNLITGATLPDEGSVRVLGADTAAMADADAWLASLDRFGIVSDRVALLDGLTVRQNIAIALTLDIDPLSDEVASAAGALGAEAGLAAEVLDVAAGAVPPGARFRVRLARGVANRPRILLAEHPTASVPRSDVSSVAADFFRLVRGRHMTVLITSVDRDFVSAADRRVVLDAATGDIRPRGLRRWFSRES
jgi:predicted ABC-type transport system involved in lysophospholipase L1 biosynthesis ATPase subunit